MEQNEVFRKTNLERISSPEKLNDYIKVISPSVVLLLVALSLLLIGGLVWGFFGRIPLTISAQGALYAIDGGEICDGLAIVTTAEDAGKIQMGMKVQVSPTSADRDSYGYISGTITRIDSYPVTQTELAQLLGSERLAELLMPETLGILVTAQLDTASDTASGLNWSTDKGSEVAVRPGTTATALLVLKEQKPIELIWEE